jgi:hypothetical protein
MDRKTGYRKVPYRNLMTEGLDDFGEAGKFSSHYFEK